MFVRTCEKNLIQWANSPSRKPLILRGARQVGKTTLINQFAKRFDTYIYLNLELKADSNLFSHSLPLDSLIQAIHFHKGLAQNPKGKTLIFIDEIQCSSQAVSMLRYFYEQRPEIYVIAAGSLLETLIDKHISFPVGRVNYQFLFPMTFSEFLKASHETEALDILSQKPIADFAHQKLLSLFHRYALLGGFPEAIKAYLENNDLMAVQSCYQDLLLGYMDDVEKYAHNRNSANIIRHCIEKAPLNAGSRIKFQSFGQSNYGSREVGEALRTLEKTMLIKLIYPTTNTLLPADINYKKSPRLQFIDTGLINYSAKLQNDYFNLNELHSIYQGKIAEHIIGQSLLANSHLNPQHDLIFWCREKAQANAEIDYVIPFKGKLIPVEVKAGKTGTLKSLHQFMSRTNHDFAIRLYSGQFFKETLKNQEGKSFTLLNLPYYLIDEIQGYLDKYSAL